MNLLISILTILSTSIASAWILPAKTIVQKTVENHGQSPYVIEQLVTLQAGDQTIQLKETWNIEDGQTMLLKVQSLKDAPVSVSLQFLYRDGQRIQLQPNGKTTKAIEPEFIELPFHVRTSEGFAYFLRQIQVAPEGILNNKPLPAKVADIKHSSEPFLRYSRHGGVVNYAFGEATAPDADSLKPGLWIEQDAFVIRKIRFPSGHSLSASDYQSHAKGLWFPKKRELEWQEKKASLQVLSVETRKPAAGLFKTSSLEITNDYNALNQQPLTALVADFYTRFR